MKKFSLLLVIVIICYLSNTPELRVMEPKTWFNEPKYEKNVSNLSFVREPTNIFYASYEKEDFAQPSFLLQKASHVFFYSLFTFLLVINLPIKKYNYLITWVMVTLFAFSDEIHQYFVVGRSGRLVDVLLDSFASFLILFLLYPFQMWKNKRNMRQPNL